MTTLYRIDKSGFRRGEYVGYLASIGGRPVRIVRGGYGWRVVGYCLSVRTLRELDTLLGDN